MQNFPGTHTLKSSLDPIDDTLVLLEYLTAKDYLVDILVTRHGVSKSSALTRTRSIIPHVRTALAYFRQARLGPHELSFLPAYYGILDLLKVYVLCGPYHGDLKAQRWHGASYEVGAKDSRSLLTEVVHLKKGGALPLYYKTVTGVAWPAPTRVTMGEVYSYIPCVSAEYRLATGKRRQVFQFRLTPEEHPHKGKKLLAARLLRYPGDNKIYGVKDFKALKLFRQHPSTADMFVGRGVPENCDYSDEAIRKQFRPFLIYSFDDHVIDTPCSSSRLLLPEELPIALLFFHMASVVRYKPEFLERIRGSRFWPIVSAARQHCLLRFLVLAWSFFHRENLTFQHTAT